jgi:hypothetical protein
VLAVVMDADDMDADGMDGYRSSLRTFMEIEEDDDSTKFLMVAREAQMATYNHVWKQRPLAGGIVDQMRHQRSFDLGTML